MSRSDGTGNKQEQEHKEHALQWDPRRETQKSLPPQPENHVPPEEERTKEGEEDLFTCLVLMKEHEPPLQRKF